MNKFLLIILIILVILFGLINGNIFEFFNIKNNYINQESKPCSDNLSDVEYLMHMIPHHQVAIDISLLLQKKTKNPIMQNILRVLIWTQNYEINLMKNMLNHFPEKITSKDKMKNNYISTVGDFTKPNKLNISNTYCDPHFFNPQKHKKHLNHIQLNDSVYIKHMIPHHQVAIDMSKKLLNNTENDFMIYLAYRIIRSQSNEIILLSDLLDKNNYFYLSNDIL